MRRVLLVTLALAACGEDSGPVGTIAGHVTHYDYTFDIDLADEGTKVEEVAPSENT